MGSASAAAVLAKLWLRPSSKRRFGSECIPGDGGVRRELNTAGRAKLVRDIYFLPPTTSDLVLLPPLLPAIGRLRTTLLERPRQLGRFFIWT